VLSPVRDAEIFYRFTLQYPFGHALVVVVLLFVLWFLAPKVWRHMTTERLAASPTLENLTEAIHLEPDRAEYRNQLGFYYMNPAEHYDPAKARANFLRATELNPAAAEYWLNLANAYQDQGLAKEAEKCVRIALQHDPRNPQLAWLSGNMKVVAGDIPGGLEDWRDSILGDPTNTHFAFDRAWRLTPDTQTLLDHLVPPGDKTDFQFLDFLATNDRGDPNLVWKRILSRNQPFDPALAASYMEWLLKPRSSLALWRQNVQKGREVWSEILHAPKTDDLIYDGGFEEALLNMGFGWREQHSDGVSLVMDYNKYQEGRRSLRIDFDKMDNLKLIPIYQVVPVEPLHRYLLTAQIRAEGITGGSPPRLAVMPSASAEAYALGQETFQTKGFIEDRVEFVAPAGSPLATLAVMRAPSHKLSPKIGGSFWVDNVVLRDLGPARGSREGSRE
jgi:hypothetical protein